MIIYKTKIQQEVYTKSWCFALSMLSCLPSWDLCKMCGRPMEEFFFLVYSACIIFFHLITFAWISGFFCTSPACPLPHNFSNGPSLKNVHILSCAWTVPIFRAVSTLKFSYGIFININNDNLITFKLHIDKIRHYNNNNNNNNNNNYHCYFYYFLKMFFNMDVIY